MYSHYDYKLKRNVVMLHPGEHYATTEDAFVSTVLGSCVAVVLFDRELRLSGMNHYMLPGSKAQPRPQDREMAGKLGVHAMELLIGALLEKGARREKLEAKVFGGGNVLGIEDVHPGMKGSDIGAANVRFAFSYLKEKNISVVSSDVEGYVARKLFLDPPSGYVYLKRLEKVLLEPVRKAELSVIEEMEKKPSAGTFELFETS